MDLISDIHLEFHPWTLPKPIATDRILIIAGDLGCITNTKTYKEFLATASTYYKYTILVAGNHEYYGTTIENAEILINQLVKQFNNIYYLQKASIVLDDIEFIGCTLWSNIESLKKWAINDGSSIKQFSLNRYRKLHTEHVEWLQTELLKPLVALKRVVVTHHLPSFYCIDAKFISYGTANCFFASDLDDLITKSDIWLCGHTHTVNTIQIGNTLVFMNPKGYPGENQESYEVLEI